MAIPSGATRPSREIPSNTRAGRKSYQECKGISERGILNMDVTKRQWEVLARQLKKDAAPEMQKRLEEAKLIAIQIKPYRIEDDL